MYIMLMNLSSLLFKIFLRFFKLLFINDSTNNKKGNKQIEIKYAFI